MSFTFTDLCSRSDADYALLQRRTDACSRLGRSYELPCRLPSSCVPQHVMLGFCRLGGRYLLYSRPPIVCYDAANPLSQLLVPPQRTFPTFPALAAHLRYIGCRLPNDA